MEIGNDYGQSRLRDSWKLPKGLSPRRRRKMHNLRSKQRKREFVKGTIPWVLAQLAELSPMALLSSSLWDTQQTYGEFHVDDFRQSDDEPLISAAAAAFSAAGVLSGDHYVLDGVAIPFVSGESVVYHRPIDGRPLGRYVPSGKHLTWPNGSVSIGFCAESPAEVNLVDELRRLTGLPFNEPRAGDCFIDDGDFIKGVRGGEPFCCRAEVGPSPAVPD